MSAVPGVERAAAALTLPYERALNNGFRLVGSTAGQQIVNVTYVTADYFDALRIPVSPQVADRGLYVLVKPLRVLVTVKTPSFCAEILK